MSLLTTHALEVSIGKNILCEQLSITIHPGDRWGILGPNGSGKTTLLHTLAGLQAPKQGAIHLTGINLQTMKRKQIARKLGILFQDSPALFPQTVWQYCATGRFPHSRSVSGQDKTAIEQALYIMELQDFQHRNVLHLSGGEKKRLALATLFAQTPLVYLLDEPLNHLDLRYQHRLMQQLKTQSDVGVIMSLHDINMAERYCSHILLIFNGNVIAGKVKDVLTSTHLSMLYQLPIHSVSHQNQIIWQISPHLGYDAYNKGE